ncbi:MAG TPA: PAS domain-containing protein [Syntrophales bacterium]|nr:PAS domain-containing protein [Syntrophales bacterium]HPN08662.1 PAS domain-containing protein [Syntrophales bacterium]HPX82213.1 PAS domain-containing protein [Syntrophales bacterium]HQB14135.1 PAS domain-containing protein [Syntrophales bacterium]
MKKDAVKKRGDAGQMSTPSGMLLHSIIQGFSIPTFVIGRDHKVIFWNRALEKLSKIPAGEIIGTNKQWRAFYAEERPCMADLIVDGITERIPKWYEGKYEKSSLLEEAYEATDFFPALGDGGLWLRFTAAAIRDVDGQLVGALETLEDVTDRKNFELKQRETERELFSVIEGSPTPTFVIGIDHKIIYWNRALEKLSRLPAADMIGTNEHWRAFYARERPCMADLLVNETPEIIEEWYPGVAKSQLLDETYEAEGFFPDLGPNGRWLKFVAVPIRSSQRVLRGAIETLEDITERKAIEQEIIENERRLYSVIQGFSIPAFVIGKDHKVMYWNRALEKLSNIKAEEVVSTNRQWQAFYAKERPCMADLLVDSALEKIPKWYSGKYCPSELIEDAYEATDFFPDLGENGRWLRFTAAVIRDSRGELVGAVETLEDITAQKAPGETAGAAAKKKR